jgi:hypothetical protein
MRIIETAVLTTLNRARAFIDAHLQQLGELESAGYRRKLDAVIAALQNHAVEQDAAIRIGAGRTARQRALRSALRLNHMRPIAMVAAARLRETPEFNSLRMPSRKTVPAQLVVAGEAMAKVSKQYTPVFIESGLAPDFVEQLEAAARSLAECITDRETTTTMKIGASAGLRTEASRGRHVLRVVSALIEPRFADNPALLAEWRTARHIRRPPTPQPVVFPLMGRARAHETANDAPTANAQATSAAAGPTPVQLALPPAAAEPVVTTSSTPLRDAFSRAIQIIAGRNDPSGATP